MSVGVGRGLTLVAVAVVAAFAAMAPASAKRDPMGSISVRIPRPGGITLRIFRLDVRLKRGVKPAHQPVLKSRNRSALPRGVAVVGTVRLLKRSSGRRASYVGLVAVFRSRAATGAKAAQRQKDYDTNQFAGQVIAHWMDAKVTPRLGYHTETRYFSSSHSVKEQVLVPDGFHLAEIEAKDFSAPASIAPGGAPPLIQAAESDLDEIFSSSSAFRDGHEFSWSVGGDVASTPTTDGLDDGVLADIRALIDHHGDVATVVGDLEQKLNTIVPNAFPAGSLDTDQTAPTSGSPGIGSPTAGSGTKTCRVQADFKATPPPYNGSGFEGPTPLAVPAGATSIQGSLTDAATGNPPPANPWPGVSWQVSYEGRLRSSDSSAAANAWEYALRMNGSGDPSQPTGPAFAWRYAVTYKLDAPACPAGATGS